MDAQTPVPAFDRRALVLQAMGFWPLLHAVKIPHQRALFVGERVHVYMDVSGSIGNLKGALYAAVMDCRRWVHPVIHVFSTCVADLSLAAVRKGTCPTTGGTDINCVAEHMKKHRVQRAVILTDGYVGTPTTDNDLVLREVQLGVALTPDGGIDAYLKSYADHWVRLEHPIAG
jgi:hypothetical protein